MSIYKGSRYEYSTIDFFKVSNQGDNNPVVFYEFSQLGLISYWEHVYVKNERLDQISHQYYKKPEFWWVIPEYNPEITDFLNIEPGTKLRIPNV
jgi:nucleoid-associated protein YgaU